MTVMSVRPQASAGSRVAGPTGMLTTRAPVAAALDEAATAEAFTALRVPSALAHPATTGIASTSGRATAARRSGRRDISDLRRTTLNGLTIEGRENSKPRGRLHPSAKGPIGRI